MYACGRVYACLHVGISDQLKWYISDNVESLR